MQFDLFGKKEYVYDKTYRLYVYHWSSVNNWKLECFKLFPYKINQKRDIVSSFRSFGKKLGKVYENLFVESRK